MNSTPPDHLRFTQNFLRDPKLVERIVKLANLQPGATVLEIGSGKGIITKELAKQVGATGKVIAVELDSELVDSLKQTFSDTPQVEIVQQDILSFQLASLPPGYAVFSNVPFNITSTLLEWLFNPLTGPAQAHLILQKDALVGEAPAPETLKSLMLKPLYTLDVAYSFARYDFVPSPGVDTALFAFTKLPEPLILPAQYDLYKDFLAFVSKDRVGEGVWRRLFSGAQLQKLTGQGELVGGRGLKMQSLAGIIDAFKVFAAGNRPKHEIVKGAMASLRVEQQKREQINRAGGHRRANPPAKNWKPGDKRKR